MLLFASLQETSSLALNSWDMRSSNNFPSLLAVSGYENYFFPTHALLHIKNFFLLFKN